MCVVISRTIPFFPHAHPFFPQCTPNATPSMQTHLGWVQLDEPIRREVGAQLLSSWWLVVGQVLGWDVELQPRTENGGSSVNP